MKQMNKGLSIAGAIFVALANILVVILAFMAWRFSNIQRTTFIAVLGALLCIVLILDVIFIFGYTTKDKKLKIVSLVFGIILFVASAYGNYLLFRVNNAVGNMINDGSAQYETISASIVTYDNSDITSVEDLDGLTVGMTEGSDASPSALGQSKLNEAGISPRYETYNSVDELMSALINKEIDCAILPSGFNSMYADQEGYSEFLDRMSVITEYSEQMQTGENTASNVDLSMEPFNVLLIGYAPESDTYGLADAIIVASVNPQSMTVTLASIPRDSYVEIAGTGSKQKINAARGISRQCLMDTVSNMMGIDIDFYMEVNFRGVVDIVDALGGIEINSPVAFLAQDSSTQRGNYTVWIEEGVQWADGEMALAFARERHAMPNGDYDRELNQQQVIAQIVSRLLELNDLNRALDALEAAGDNFETNISLDQMTSLFNYLLSIPNFSGLDTMDLINIQNMRVTGYSSYYYDYGSGLNLWIMIPYNGSIEENSAMMNETLGITSVEQVADFSFTVQEPYERGQLYHEVFDEARQDPELPEMVPDFVSEGASIMDVEAWASENNVTLNVVYIDETDDRYVEGAEGLVVGTEPGSGTLVENLSGPLTVYVAGDATSIPNFVGASLTYVTSWAERNGYELEVDYVETGDQSLDGTIADQTPSAGNDIENYSTLYVDVYTYVEGTGPSEGENTGASPYEVPGMSYEEAVSWCDTNGYVCLFLDPEKNFMNYGTVTDTWGEYADGTLWFTMTE